MKLVYPSLTESTPYWSFELNKTEVTWYVRGTKYSNQDFAYIRKKYPLMALFIKNPDKAIYKLLC